MQQTSDETLTLRFHGRIIDHLGIQMYQSPVAAVAELVANAWDADADRVEIALPEHMNAGAEIVIKDNGSGMTFKECQDRYLNVGWCRRGENMEERSPGKRRPILGRKGIGKFAGFGVAEVIRVETISGATGEKTVFELDINELRTDEYVAEGKEVPVREHSLDDDRKDQHGTKISLSSLTLKRTPSAPQFARSMARRFLLLQWTDEFQVSVNGQPVPESVDLAQVQYVFPRDYAPEDKPVGLTMEKEWGKETLSNGQEVQWKVYFFREPIQEEELRGLSVFSNVKLAQRPFFFNLSGGLSGQQGQEYICGQVKADYIDLLGDDLIATERQRINWEHEAALPLQEWGQKRIRQLLRIWHDERGEARRKRIEDRVAGFSDRLDSLQSHERRTVRTALNKLGGITTLSDSQFDELGQALLNAWERGRLHGLIDDLSQEEQLTAQRLLELLAEADILVALSVAEEVRTKLDAIRALRKMVEAGELENAVRDYIAEKPYLLHPKWDTFKKETSVRRMLHEAANEAKLQPTEDDPAGRKRIDLALRSNEHLLVVEFMRPGVTADYDHLSRCRQYVYLVRGKVTAETALGIEKVTGLIVADHLTDMGAVPQALEAMKNEDIHAYSWESLLREAERTWRDFLGLVAERAPDDQRVRSLTEECHDRAG